MALQKFKHDLINKDFQNAVETNPHILTYNSPLSFSQSCQDLFVVAMLEGQSHKTFLEIGCNQPKYSNNTFVLEKFFLFTGVSIDLLYDEHQKFNQHLDITERSWALCRPATVWYKTDALLFDYSVLPDYFDYLQIDIDTPLENLTMLEKLCSDKKFAVITFEHDDWNNKFKDANVKYRSREYLHNKGYELVASDVGVIDGRRLLSYEDWWVHPDFVKREIIDSYKIISSDIKPFEQILFNILK